MIRMLSILALMACSSMVHAGIPKGKVMTINAYVSSFGCGEDACYVSIDKSGGETIQAVCSSAEICEIWANKLGDKDELHIDQKARVTLKSEYFQSAGENFWHVKKVVLLK